MNRATRWFRFFESRADRGWEITKRDPLPLIAAFVVVLLLAGCSGPMSNEDFILETAKCEANGFAARALTSGWDGDRTGVQCYTPRVFKPTFTEFKLEDGTQCIMFSTSPDTSRRAGSSGVSCDWNGE
ncbi:MAG: hypothetical protein ACTSPB_08460 [Candidatus Thorarchaeota archaeon]